MANRIVDFINSLSGTNRTSTLFPVEALIKDWIDRIERPVRTPEVYPRR